MRERRSGAAAGLARIVIEFGTMFMEAETQSEVLRSNAGQGGKLQSGAFFLTQAS